MMNNMQKALDYFAKMGIPIKDGLIDVKALTDEQIELLKQWENETEIEGIMMPEIDDFYRSVLLAISTNPQKTEDGKIRYLFGKGIGVEIALRGEIEDRIKYNTLPIYRSHSDFELYDTKENPYGDSIFRDIFGSQEIYPETATKGLKNLPEGYMDSTYEKVNLDGYEVLVPQLEILFLDKFLRGESTPRNGVYDCELLAQEYELDIDLLKEYLEKYYFKHNDENLKSSESRYKINFNKIICRNIKNGLYEQDDIEVVINELNNHISEITTINTVANGIRPKMYIPITMQDFHFDENGNIVLNEDYSLRTTELISNMTQQEIQNYREETLQRLEELFKRVAEKRVRKPENKKQLGVSDFEEVAYDKHTVGTLETAKNAVITEQQHEEEAKKENGGQSISDD